MVKKKKLQGTASGKLPSPLTHEIDPAVEENDWGMPITQRPSPSNGPVSVPNFTSSIQDKLFWAQAQYGRPHMQPASVALSIIGTMYRPGCWAAIADMFVYTQKQGLTVWLNEIKDPRSTIPYTQLGSMMDHACRQAQDRGAEYIALMQSDTLPKPDLLVNLLRSEMPIVVPIILEQEPGNYQGLGVGGPNYAPNTGIKPMRWAPLPMLLIKATVFNCCGDFFGSQPTEDMSWQRFWHYGHRPWQDTSQVLGMATQATRFGSLDFDEQWQWLRSVDERRRIVADRGGSVAGSGDKLVMPNGIYMPWKTEEQVAEAWEKARMNGAVLVEVLA